MLVRDSLKIINGTSFSYPYPNINISVTRVEVCVVRRRLLARHTHTPSLDVIDLLLVRYSRTSMSTSQAVLTK